MPRFLHVGCGHLRKQHTPLASVEWEEVTLDIDEKVKPDIVDKLPELAKVESGSFDAVFTSHNIEHLYAHEVPVAFKAFHRVLKSDGILLVTCPDLQSLGERLTEGDIHTPLYMSSAGPISPIDILYGHRPPIEQGNVYMAHHTGFTIKALEATCVQTGFSGFIGCRSNFTLLGIATKEKDIDADKLHELARTYITPIF